MHTQETSSLGEPQERSLPKPFSTFKIRDKTASRNGLRDLYDNDSGYPSNSASNRASLLGPAMELHASCALISNLAHILNIMPWPWRVTSP